MLDNKGFDLWAYDYDTIVGLPDDDNTNTFAGYKLILNKIYNEVLDLYRKNILDIGYSAETITIKLYEKWIEVYEQDFSKGMLNIAQAKMLKANLYLKDISEDLRESLKEWQYDAIIATYSLHHLEDKNKISLLKSLLPLLVDGGKIFIGYVAFETREELEHCKQESGKYRYSDENYFVYDEI